MLRAFLAPAGVFLMYSVSSVGIDDIVIYDSPFLLLKSDCPYKIPCVKSEKSFSSTLFPVHTSLRP